MYARCPSVAPTFGLIARQHRLSLAFIFIYQLSFSLPLSIPAPSMFRLGHFRRGLLTTNQAIYNKVLGCRGDCDLCRERRLNELTAGALVAGDGYLGQSHAGNNYQEGEGGGCLFVDVGCMGEMEIRCTTHTTAHTQFETRSDTVHITHSLHTTEIPV